MTIRLKLSLALMLIGVGCAAQSTEIDPAARRGIAAGNQAWITGLKGGNAAIIAASYAENALDCPAAGDCISGRAAIEARMKERSAKLGRAGSASVASAGAVQQGDFVYEWGSAEASFAGGMNVAGHYLTVWQKQTDGSWKIFRNMTIPGDGGH